MLQFPPQLEKILLRYIKQTFWQSKKKSDKVSDFNEKDFRYFSKGADRLSTAFTEERGDLPKNYFNDPVLRSGYLLYFLPVNFFKVYSILNQLPPRELTSGQVRILDLGSGPGTSMLGAMTFYAEALKKGLIKDAWLDFTLIDQNYNILQDAKNLHDAYKEHLEKTVPGFRSTISVKNYDLQRGGLSRFLRDVRFHLVLMSNILNEFPQRDMQASLAGHLMEHHLEPGKGKLVLIEPALKKTSRDLQYVRDELVVGRQLAEVLAPCLHQEECPLNVINKRDWCHFYFSWKKPAFIEKVDKLIGNKKDWLSCSYLVLAHRPGETPKLSAEKKSTWRVISNMIYSKGKKEVIICGPLGRYRLELLDKEMAAKNRDFDRIRRGDLIHYDVHASDYRVDGVRKLKPSDSIRIEERP